MLPQLLLHAAEHAEAMPESEGHEIKNRHREASVDLSLLRQVGDLSYPQAAPLDVAAKGAQDPRNSLQQGALARAVRPHYRGHRSGLEDPRKMMDRGVPVIAQSEIVQSN